MKIAGESTESVRQMSDPIALERARGVLRHILALGGRLSDFTVSVTAEEGFELIAWFRAKAQATDTNLAQLDTDIQTAQDCGDPWVVLDHYELLGLKISRRLH